MQKNQLQRILLLIGSNHSQKIKSIIYIYFHSRLSFSRILSVCIFLLQGKLDFRKRINQNFSLQPLQIREIWRKKILIWENFGTKFIRCIPFFEFNMCSNFMYYESMIHVLSKYYERSKIILSVTELARFDNRLSFPIFKFDFIFFAHCIMSTFISYREFALS